MVRSYSPIGFGFPSIVGGSAPASPVSGPAQRSHLLRPTNLPSRLKRPSTPQASAASLPPLLLRLLPGGANSSRAGLSPAVNQRLFTAHNELRLAARLEPCLAEPIKQAFRQLGIPPLAKFAARSHGEIRFYNQ